MTFGPEPVFLFRPTFQHFIDLLDPTLRDLYIQAFARHVTGHLAAVQLRIRDLTFGQYISYKSAQML